MQDTTNGPIAPKAENMAVEFDLTVGKETFAVGIIEAKGKHVTRAQQIMGGEETRYYPALMHVVCRIGGKVMPMEYYEEMPMHAFSALMVRLNTEGFTG